jgi:hypothetical protein
MGQDIINDTENTSGKGVAKSDLLANWLEVLIEYMDGQSWQMVGIDSMPQGDRQESDCELFDHEYVEQKRAYEDSFHGHLWFPLGDQGEGYLKVYFFS